MLHYACLTKIKKRTNKKKQYPNKDHLACTSIEAEKQTINNSWGKCNNPDDGGMDEIGYFGRNGEKKKRRKVISDLEKKGKKIGQKFQVILYPGDQLGN